MATFYWIGGSGSWSDPTFWSSSSGGTSGTSTPTYTDDVIFDANSGSGNYTVTIPAGYGSCNNLNAGNPTGGVLTLGATTSDLISAFGGATFATGVVYTGLRFDVGGDLYAPTQLVAADLNVIGNINLLAAFTSNSITTNSSSFTTNGYALTVASNIDLTYSTSALYLGSSSVQCSGLIRNSNSPVDAGTSTITFTNSAGSVTGIVNNASTPLTLYDVVYDVGGNIFLDGAITGTANITMNSFRVTARTATGVATVRITAGRTITVTNAFSVNASSGPSCRIKFLSLTVGSPATISAGSYSLADCDFQDITASGTTLTGTRLGDCKGNTNITFPAAKTVYWNLAGTNNWDAVGWATTSGGTPAANNFPLAQDTMVIDNTGAITQLTLNGLNSSFAGLAVSTVSMTRTTAFTLNLGSYLYVLGDFTVSSGAALGGVYGIYFIGRNTQNLTSAGKTFTFSLVVSSLGGTVVLQDAVTATNSGSLAYGTLNLNLKTLTLTTFNTSGTGVRNITFNGGSIALSGSSSTTFNASTATNFTTTAGTGSFGTITMSGGAGKGFAGGGATYNCVINNSQAVTLLVTGSNTFLGFYGSTGSSVISFASGSTNAVGFIRAPLTVTATGVTAATLTYSGAYGGNGNLENGTASGSLTISKITFSGGTWYAGANSVSGGTTTNVSFTTPTKYWVGGSGTWDGNNAFTGAGGSRTNWSLTSGGAGGEWAPTNRTAVTFDASSGTAGYTVTMSSAVDVPACWNFNVSGLTPSFSGTTNFTIAGSIATSIAVTWSVVGTVTLNSFYGTSQTITTGGALLPMSFTLSNVNATWTLTGATTLGSANTITLTGGTLALSTYTLTCGALSSNNSNIRGISFGTGNITLIGSGTIWDLTTVTNLTITGTPVLNVANNSATAATMITGALSETTAPSINVNVGTYTLTLSGSGIKDLNFTGFTGTLANSARAVYGSLTLVAGMTLTAGVSQTSFVTTGGTKTITTAGKLLDFPIGFGGVGGTWTLQDAFTVGSTRTVTHTNSTINLNGKTLTAGASYTTGTGTKNLTFNGGTLLCAASGTTAFNNAVPTGFTTTAGTGTGYISMSAASAKTFVGGGSTFNCTLQQAGAGALTITGANTFSDITNTTQPATIIFPSATTTTFTTAFSLSGISGSLITLQSSTAGTQATVSKASGTVSCSYLSIKDSAATGGALWYAGSTSTNVSNNTGWNFTGPGGSSNFLMFF